jgi:hypothetical protein
MNKLKEEHVYNRDIVSKLPKDMRSEVKSFLNKETCAQITESGKTCKIPKILTKEMILLTATMFR